MRHPLRFVVFVLVLALALVAGLPVIQGARAQPSGITINGADAVNTFSITGDSTLFTLIKNVTPRFTLQYANELSTLPLVSIPDSLRTLLQSVQARFILQYANQSETFQFSPPPESLVTLIRSVDNRFVLEYANSAKFYTFNAPPPALEVLLQSIEDRIVLQYANQKTNIALNYPAALIGDTTPPAILLWTSHLDNGLWVIHLKTDELTTATINCGEFSGKYTYSAVDDQFNFVHDIPLPGLLPQKDYFCRAGVMDRSGNTSLSNEYMLAAATKIFLPAIMKH